MADEVNNIQERGSDPEHIKKIYQMLDEMHARKETESTDPPKTEKNVDIEELEAYRERDRQAILSEFSKELQEEYQGKTLQELRDIQKLRKEVIKREVGQIPPTPDTTPKKKEFGWCYTCGKNHSGACR